MPDKNKIFKHLQDTEKITILRRILDLLELTSKNYSQQVSDFLDPYEQQLVASLTSHYPEIELNFLPVGNRERKVAVFSPYPIVHEENTVAAFSIESRFKIDHRNILGSILSLGIERSKIGDIIVADTSYIIIKGELTNFMHFHFNKIGNQTIVIEEIPLSEVPNISEKWHRSSAIVSSMRLDSVIRAVTHLPRDEVKLRLNKGLVKVNFKKILKPHEILNQGDLISLRGFGRIKIFDDLSGTKKGKIRFAYGTLNHK